VPAAALLLISPPGAVATGILGALAILFALFGMRTALRHLTRIEVTETGLSATGPVRAEIPWGELDRIRLDYYSTRRDRRSGWMQLDLRAGRAAIRIDSRIDQFRELVERAMHAAALRGLDLNAATAANLEALAIHAPEILDTTDQGRRRT
jgi:hypothetical protein